MSNLANSMLRPVRLILSIAESTVIYFSEHNSFGMPPLTLPLVEWERSTIILHLFGWWCLGMTPNLLTCACGTKNSWNGPATHPRAMSSVR